MKSNIICNNCGLGIEMDFDGKYLTCDECGNIIPKSDKGAQPFVDVSPELIKLILETPFCLKTLRSEEMYSRPHDDTDGDKSENVSVYISVDSDVWITIGGIKPFKTMRRFRTFSGGGQSLRTRNALLILAEAIRLDNLERRIDK